MWEDFLIKTALKHDADLIIIYLDGGQFVFDDLSDAQAFAQEVEDGRYYADDPMPNICERHGAEGWKVTVAVEGAND